MTSEKVKNTTYRTEFHHNQFRTILNLSDSITKDSQTYSLFDVDVIRNLDSDDDLINQIDICHTEQKRVFFSCITEEFLNSLNPEY